MNNKINFFSPGFVLGMLMAGYAAVFVAFYPPISGIEDEVGFINQARVWSLGALSSEGAGIPFTPYDFIEVAGRHVPARHPGRSLMALPFLMLGGGRAIYLSGLAMHLTMTSIGASLLVKLGRSPLWASLLLFHPTLAIYSRTIMADGASGMGLLLAARALISGCPIAAGLWVGLAAAMRYHAGIALPLVAISFLRLPGGDSGKRKRWLDATSCSLAGLAVGSLLVAYNLAAYGTPLEPYTMHRGWFSTEFFWPHLAFYETSLMIVWPGILLTPLLDRSRLRWLTRGVILVFLGPLLFYYFHDRAPGWLETQILGQRLIQVALPLWIIAYAGVVDDLCVSPVRGLFGAKARTVLVASACLALFASNIVASFQHQRHLLKLASARDDLASHVPAGSTIVYEGALFKLALSRGCEQLYRTLHLECGDQPTSDPTVSPSELDGEARPWFLAVLKRSPNAAVSTGCLGVIGRFELEPIPVESPLLVLYRAPAPRHGREL